MEGSNVSQEKQQPPAVPQSCRKYKKDDATFLEDLKGHIDEFVNASMDEHKSCFKKTMTKMFGMSRVVAAKQAEEKGVESVLPLQTSLSK